MRVALLSALLAFACGCLGAAQAPLPAGWPSVFQFGMYDAPNGAQGLAQSAPFGFRYIYFNGGANTGTGWSTYNTPAGQYATYYFQEAFANNLIPVVIYYQMLQSLPHSGADEASKDLGNFDNLSTMQAWFADLTLLLQKAGAFTGKLVVVNIEPDFWGHIQSAAAANGGVANVPGKVGSCGGNVAGFPDNAAGFAQAISHLRDLYAPNVVFGFHASIWGTGWDLLRSTPKADNTKAAALGVQTGAFFNSLGANSDLIFSEFLDADSAYDQFKNNDTSGWYHDLDYQNLSLFFANLSSTTNKRIVVWQAPIGNTLMRACNNTSGHYQSNEVEWLLNDPARTNLTNFANAGVVAVLFGAGLPGCTIASDSQNDGVTNPAPAAANAFSTNPNPNDIQSALGAAGSAPSYNASAKTLTTPYAKDDDGGYLRWKVHDYYQAGALALTSGGGASKLAFTVQPTTSAAGTSIAPAVQVAIEDASGAPIAGATYRVALAVGAGPGTLAGTTSVAAINGVATFPNLSIATTGAGYTLVASAGLLTGATSTTFDITAPPPPIITSFSPPRGGIGASVLITGTGFGAATAATFSSNKTAIFTVDSATQITAVVPAGATTGTISITNAGGTGISAATFTVVPPPTIASMTPTTGGAGTVVTITGANLGGVTAVSFNGTAAAFAVVSATQITATVPDGATDGPISVTSPWGSASSTNYITGSAPESSSSSSKKCGDGVFGAIGILLLSFFIRRDR